MTIQVFLFSGGENGILVKKYLKIPISPLLSISSEYQNLHLKSKRFKIKKNRGGENGMTFPGGENGISPTGAVSVSLMKAFVQLWNLLGMENYKTNAYKLLVIIQAYFA